MKAHLCQCNKCNTILYDENPQVNTKEIEISDFEEILPMELLNDEGDSYWGCPICNTDAYLSDEIKV